MDPKKLEFLRTLALGAALADHRLLKRVLKLYRGLFPSGSLGQRLQEALTGKRHHVEQALAVAAPEGVTVIEHVFDLLEEESRWKRHEAAIRAMKISAAAASPEEAAKFLESIAAELRQQDGSRAAL